LGLVALRSDYPFIPEPLLNVLQCAYRHNMNIRWVVCGDGRYLDQLKQIAQENNLPVSFLGRIPYQLVDKLLPIADVAAAPIDPSASTRFIEECVQHDIPTLIPKDMQVDSRLDQGKINPIDFANQDQVGRILKRIFGDQTDCARPAALPKDNPQAGQIADPATDTDQVVNTRPVSPSQLQNGYVLYNDWGIGDELLLSAVAREIKRFHPQLPLWIRSRYGFKFLDYSGSSAQPNPDTESIQVIYQNAALYGPEYHSPFPGHLVQQMLDKFALDTGLAIKAQDVRPEILIPSGAMEQRQSNAIMLHTMPNRRLPSKDWGIDRWRELGRLLGERGMRLIQVGAQDEPYIDGAEDYRGVSVDRLPELMVQVSAVVCLVGLLMHLAAATKTNAVVIYGGREHPDIDGYPDHIHLCSEPLNCRGRWGCHLPADVECPHAMRCMTDLTPDLVAFELESLLPKQEVMA